MQKRSFVRIVIFCLLAFFITFGGVIVHNNMITAEQPPTREGLHFCPDPLLANTLWSIASRYCDSVEAIPSYVEELKQMNSMSNERSLTAGRYLTVYYWEEGSVNH